MRNIIYMCVALVALVACTSEKKDAAAGVYESEETVSKDRVNSMSDFNLDGTIEVDGLTYNYEFAFECDESLPVVTTADDYQYYDNHVKLIISRGQQVAFERTFTKATFESLVPAADYRRCVLAGFNRNYMKEDLHDCFYFVAVVGDPDESGDISHTIGIAIDRSGNADFSVIKNIDTDTAPQTTPINGDPDEDAA